MAASLTKQCYICWEQTGTEENPIRNDCHCKGSMGHVHLHCLIQSSQAKEGLLVPWKRCPHCLQPYRDPTKTALERAMSTDWQRRFVACVWMAAKTLLGCVAYFSLYFTGVYLTEHAFQTLFSHLVGLWDQVSVEYANNGTIVSPSSLQLLAIGCTLMGLGCRFWWHILSFFKKFLIHFSLSLAAMIAMEVVGGITGLDETTLFVLAYLVFLAYQVYRHRVEFRVHGWIRSLTGIVIIIVAYAIYCYIERAVLKMYRDPVYHYVQEIELVVTGRVGRFSGETRGKAWVSIDKRISSIDEQIHSQVARIKSKWSRELKKQLFKKEINSMRQDYWWCCA